MRIPLSHIRTNAARRPVGYYDDVISHGRVNGDDLELDDMVYWDLVRKYQPGTPSLKDMANNFARSMADWVRAGFPVVDGATYAHRANACQSCEYRIESDFAWRCRKCGCSSMKLWLSTAACPDSPPRWLATNNSTSRKPEIQ
jgi:hypothetical protein